MQLTPEDLWASLVGYCDTIIQLAAAEGITLNFINYDSHAEIEELPELNLLGLVGFAFEDLGNGTFTIGAGIGFSMWQDEELFNHRKLVGIVHEAIQPEKSLDILNANTGIRIAGLTIESPTSLLPMSNSSVRALQFYTFSGTTFSLS